MADSLAQSDGLSRWLRPRRLAAAAKRIVERRLYGDAFWNFYRKLELFVPVVRGPSKEVVRLAFQAAHDTFPLLATVVDELGSDRVLIVEVEEFCQSDLERSAAGELKILFDRHGSDKASEHNYHFVYGAILTRIQKVNSLLEVGLGSNHEDTVSHMGAAGRPGASLRAFRDYLPGAKIYGADVDRRILFEEHRIKTFFVDQTDLASFGSVEALGEFELVIDDGLHSPNANLAVLLLGIKRMSVGGWLVIEDISFTALPLWKVVSALLPPRYRPCIVRTRRSLLFVLERIS